MPYRESSATLCGRTYTMRTHPATEAIDLMKCLGKYLPQEIIEILIRAQVEVEATAQLKTANVMSVMLARIYGYHPPVADGSDASKDLSFWARECFKYCSVSPLPWGVDLPGSAHEHFDQLFSGNLGEMVEVLMWLLPANFTTPSTSIPSQNGESTRGPGGPAQESTFQKSTQGSSSSSKTGAESTFPPTLDSVQISTTSTSSSSTGRAK